MNLRYLKNDHDLALQDSVKRIDASKDSLVQCRMSLKGIPVSNAG